MWEIFWNRWLKCYCIKLRKLINIFFTLIATSGGQWGTRGRRPLGGRGDAVPWGDGEEGLNAQGLGGRTN